MLELDIAQAVRHPVVHSLWHTQQRFSHRWYATQVYRGLRNGVQDVAVKVLHYADDAQLRQFEKEIALLRSLNHDRWVALPALVNPM